MGALNVLTSDGQYSWLNMIRQGATCTMETWPGGVAPGSGGTGGTWSHPWCAGPNSVVIRHLLGVQPIALGWRRFRFAPQPSSLRSLEAVVPIALAGASAEITVNLTQSASSLSVLLTIPDGTTSRVCMPQPHALEPGVATSLLLDGAPALLEAEGRMLCF